MPESITKSLMIWERCGPALFLPVVQTKRLFVGVEIPSTCKMALLALDPHLTGLRWLPEEQVHLTLSFLGNVGSFAEDRLRQALREVRVPPLFCRCVASVSSTRTVARRWSGQALAPGIRIFLRCTGTFNMLSFTRISNLILNLFVRTLRLRAPKAFPVKHFNLLFVCTQSRNSVWLK
jgi:hypothetical protein